MTQTAENTEIDSVEVTNTSEQEDTQTAENTEMTAKEFVQELQETKMKNYYVFQPHQYVFENEQADEKGIFIAEEGSKQDEVCKIRNGFPVSEWIRDLGFVSPESVQIIIGRLADELESAKAESSELKEKISGLQKDNLELAKDFKATKDELESAKAESKTKATPKKTLVSPEENPTT